LKNYLLDRIRSSEIIQSVMTLSIGTIIAQLIPILASLILARLYTPDDYGNWGIFSSYAAIFTVIICGRYEYAILRPKRLIDAFHLCILSIAIGGVISFFLYVILVFFFLSNFTYITSIKGILWLPLYVLVSGLLQVFVNYANRGEQYKIIASSSVLRSCIQAIFRIFFGLMEICGGLIVGAMLGLFGGNVCFIRKFPFRRILHYISLNRVKELIKEYKKFPIYEVPSGLLNVMSTNIPLLLLSYFFHKEYVGYFSMAITILYMPISFIGIALGQVFYKKACVWNGEQIAGLAIKIFRLTFFTGAIPVLLLTLYGNDIFAFLLGKHWGITGTFAMYMSIWIWLVLCFLPLSTVFWVKDKQRIGMILNLAMLILRVLVIFIGGYLLRSVFQTILLYGITGIILWFVEGLYIWKLLDINVSRKDIFYVLFVAFVVIGVWTMKILYS